VNGGGAATPSPLAGRAGEGASIFSQRELPALDGDVHGVDGELSALDGDVHGVDGELPALDGDVHGVDGELSALDGDVHGVDGELPALDWDVPALDVGMRSTRSRKARATARWRASVCSKASGSAKPISFARRARALGSVGSRCVWCPNCSCRRCSAVRRKM
jgi:hypothetical protein